MTYFVAGVLKKESSTPKENKKIPHQVLLPTEEHHGKQRTTLIKFATQCEYLASFAAVMGLLKAILSRRTLQWYLKYFLKARTANPATTEVNSMISTGFGESWTGL